MADPNSVSLPGHAFLPSGPLFTREGVREALALGAQISFDAPAELRPPPEHEEKTAHFVQFDMPNAVIGPVETWVWGVQCGQQGWLMPGRSGVSKSSDCEGYRYLGPAEWNPVAADVAKRLDAGAGAYHALSVANDHIAVLEVRIRGAQERTEIALKHYKSVLSERDEARRRVADLESVVEHLTAERLQLLNELADLKATTKFAARAEADLVSATFPANALKHSR